MLRVFTTFYGKKKLIDESNMIKRVSGYTVIIDNDALLLIKNRSTGKLWFPGGVVEGNESPEDAAIRETKEESGVTVQVTRLLGVVESYFYFDHADAANHQFSYFYQAKLVNGDITLVDNPDLTDEAIAPEWYKISELYEDQFQDYGWEVLKLI